MCLKRERKNAESLNLKLIPACVALKPLPSVGGWSSLQREKRRLQMNAVSCLKQVTRKGTLFPLHLVLERFGGGRKFFSLKYFVNLDKSNCFQAESSTGRRSQLFVEKIKLLEAFDASWVKPCILMKSTCLAIVANFFATDVHLTSWQIQVRPHAFRIASESVCVLGFAFWWRREVFSSGRSCVFVPARTLRQRAGR